MRKEGENMARKLVVAALTGTIYDAQMTKTAGVMSGNRRDRTDEAITAVAEHMKMKAEENDGFYQYIWEGVGTLTWESEKAAE